jgi:GT2 family glycosyltransferase
LLKSGCTCSYEPFAFVRHKHRRTYKELKDLLYNYGYATRCYFERVSINFPSDKESVNRLIRWWWRHWAYRRFITSFWCPGRFPLQLVSSELKGFFNGMKSYKKTRSKLVQNENERPDKFFIGETAKANLMKYGNFSVDLEEPLQDLEEGKRYEQVNVIVTYQGKTVGSLRFDTIGDILSAQRLAVGISQSYAEKILGLGYHNNSIGKTQLQYDLSCFLRINENEIESQEKQKPPVTVIVATCNRPESLRKCLLSIQNLKYAGKVEIIVVNNRPEHTGASEVVSEFKSILYLEESRCGSSYARNSAILSASHEIIAITDDDMIVSEQWLDHLVAEFDRNDVIAVTGNTLPAKVESNAEQNFEAYGGFSRGFSRIEYNQDWLHRGKRAAPTWNIGGSGNMAFRSTFFKNPESKVFMETLGAGVPAGVGEDTMMFYQILHSGGTIIYEPSAVAWHHHRITDRELSRQIYAYSKGHIAYHIITWQLYRDFRAISRIFIEIPLSIICRVSDNLKGKNRYPLRLLCIEIFGALLGPIALIQSKRNDRYYQSIYKNKIINNKVAEKEMSFFQTSR